jgi:hypothetical protein
MPLVFTKLAEQTIGIVLHFRRKWEREDNTGGPRPKSWTTTEAVNAFFRDIGKTETICNSSH